MYKIQTLANCIVGKILHMVLTNISSQSESTLQTTLNYSIINREISPRHKSYKLLLENTKPTYLVRLSLINSDACICQSEWVKYMLFKFTYFSFSTYMQKFFWFLICRIMKYIKFQIIQSWFLFVVGRFRVFIKILNMGHVFIPREIQYFIHLMFGKTKHHLL